MQSLTTGGGGGVQSAYDGGGGVQSLTTGGGGCSPLTTGGGGVQSAYDGGGVQSLTTGGQSTFGTQKIRFANRYSITERA